MPILYKIDRKEGIKENQLEFSDRRYGLMPKTNKQRSRFQSLGTAVVLLGRLWKLQYHPGVRDVQLGYPGVLRATDSFVLSHTPLPVDSVRYLPERGCC